MYSNAIYFHITKETQGNGVILVEKFMFDLLLWLTRFMSGYSINLQHSIQIKTFLTGKY